MITLTKDAAREKAFSTPIGRIVYPNDIADATILVVSERAGFVSGEDILVDGGLEKSFMTMIPRPGHEAPGKGQAVGGPLWAMCGIGELPVGRR